MNLAGRNLIGSRRDLANLRVNSPVITLYLQGSLSVG
jgi:hypothetical protein